MARSFQKLDRAAIRKLKRRERVMEGGIIAERLADGDVRWSVNIMVDGQRVHRVIGRESEGTTRTQAEDFISKTRTEAREGRLSLPRGRKLHLSFDSAAELYIENLKEISGKDIDRQTQHLKSHLRPFLGSMRLDRITEFTLEKLRRHLGEKGLGEATVVRVFATYRRMARRLLKWGKIKTPLPMLKLSDPDNRRTYVLSNDEEEALLGVALQDSNTRIHLFIKLALGTSLRRNEVLSARFDGFDLVRRRLKVKVKGGRWREQPLARRIVDLLERERKMAQDQEGFIFPSTKTKAGHVTEINEAFRRVAMAAGLDPRKITPHTLRHTAITRLVASGADVKTVQEFSGHRSLTMVMRYTHAQDRAIDAALDRMEGHNVVEHPAAKKARES